MVDLWLDVISPRTLSRSNIFLSSWLVLPDVARILYLLPFLSVVKYSTSFTIFGISLSFFLFVFGLVFFFSAFFSFASSKSVLFVSIFFSFFELSSLVELAILPSSLFLLLSCEFVFISFSVCCGVWSTIIFSFEKIF